LRLFGMYGQGFKYMTVIADHLRQIIERGGSYQSYGAPLYHNKAVKGTIESYLTLDLQPQTHTRPAMKHECTRCRKVFQSIRSFDQHGRKCRKKTRPSPLTQPLASEGNTRLSPKRARVGSPDEDIGESDEDDQDVRGPDISIARDVSCRLSVRHQAN
jgi:hypothetical protein